MATSLFLPEKVEEPETVIAEDAPELGKITVPEKVMESTPVEKLVGEETLVEEDLVEEPIEEMTTTSAAIESTVDEFDVEEEDSAETSTVKDVSEKAAHK